MWAQVQICNRIGLLKFFRRQIVNLEESLIIQLGEDYEREIKQIKDNRYRIGWYMRGSMSYHDLMYKITTDDLEIFNKIIQDNLETVEKTKLPLL
jgi:hypothetical protein